MIKDINRKLIKPRYTAKTISEIICNCNNAGIPFPDLMLPLIECAGNKTHEMCHYNHGVFDGNNGVPYWIRNSVVFFGNTTNDWHINCSNNPILTPEYVTLMAKIRLAGFISSDQVQAIAGIWDTGANERAYSLYTSYTVPQPDRLYFSISTDGTWNVSAYNYISILATEILDKDVVIIATWDGTTPRVFFNGVEQSGTTGGSGSGAIHSSSSDFLVSCHMNSGTPYRPFDGLIDFIAMWDHVLTDQQIYKLSMDPFCLIRPLEKPSYLMAGIAPPTTAKSIITIMT